MNEKIVVIDVSEDKSLTRKINLKFHPVGDSYVCLASPELLNDLESMSTSGYYKNIKVV